jgi:hypothetical protein
VVVFLNNREFFLFLFDYLFFVDCKNSYNYGLVISLIASKIGYLKHGFPRMSGYTVSRLIVHGIKSRYAIFERDIKVRCWIILTLVFEDNQFRS